MRHKIKLIGLLVVLSIFMTGCSDIESMIYYYDIDPLKGFIQKDGEVELTTNTMSREQLLQSLGIYNGITINGVDIGSDSKLEAERKLKEAMEQHDAETRVEFVSPNKTYKYYISDFQGTYDYGKAIEEAYAIGRSGTDKERLDKIKDVNVNHVDIPLEVIYKQDTIDAYVKAISNELNKYAIDGTYKYENGDIIPIAGTDGLIVDAEQLEASIKELVASPGSREIAMVVDKAEEVDVEQVRANLGPIGSSTTKYGSSGSGRKYNIKLSTERMNGTVIKPGESVSMNDIVGNANSANGFKMATVIENGEFVDGVGGGVCQTSTTLYQAAVKADLTILDRSHHSRPIGYTPKALDAAIFYGSQDLVIRNDFEFPVVIEGNANGSELTFTILGDKSIKNYEITLSSKTTAHLGMPVKKVANSSLASGETKVVQKGWPGYRATSYKHNSLTGETEVLTQDYYSPRTQIVHYGP